MQEILNNCFRWKKCSMALCQVRTSAEMLQQCTKVIQRTNVSEWFSTILQNASLWWCFFIFDTNMLLALMPSDCTFAFFFFFFFNLVKCHVKSFWIKQLLWFWTCYGICVQCYYSESINGSFFNVCFFFFSFPYGKIYHSSLSI